VDNVADGLIRHPTRGLSEAQLAELTKAVKGLSALALELPEVSSADVNPIRVSDSGIVAVDALLVLGGG
jgi:hypothetical protein